MPNFIGQRRKCFHAVTAVLTAVVLLVLPFLSFADDTISSAGKRDQTVRVLLSRMNLTDRFDLTLAAPYLLRNKQGLQIHMKADSQVTFLMREDSIYLHYQGLVQDIGEEAELLRSAVNEAAQTGFYRTNFPELYMGDLFLSLQDGKLRPVLSIHVEDYLLGVVPYEMSETFPLEALKAQAVAARNYALRKQNSERDYDVVDTTNDQVFKGYLPGNTRCEQAIRETRGICGFYKDSLAQCYYSASNGGQMELVESVWDTEGDFGYYVFGDDPYDIANPESVVRSFEVMKKYSSQEAPYELRELLSTQLDERFPDLTPETLRIDRVNTVAVADPVQENSKLFKTLKIDVNISVQSKQEPIRLIDSDTEEVSIFLVEATPESISQPLSPPPSDEPQATYGPFRHVDEAISLSIPIFPDAEYRLGMDISGNYENEIWSVREKTDRFVIEARRYGHGVGMSQRGAQQMAGGHNWSYKEILGFYYPGIQLKCYEENRHEPVSVEEVLTENAGPAASPTPRPTLMPSTMQAQKGEWFALVSEISEDSSLNLRSEPNLSSEIRMRLYKNQRLLVLEKCPQEGWVKVTTDVADGYVMEKYLTKE